MLKHRGMTSENLNDTLAISVFVDQAAPNTQKYFKEHVPGWQGEILQKILSVAVYVYVGREERQMKEKKKAKEQEAGLLAVALARNLQARES